MRSNFLTEPKMDFLPTFLHSRDHLQSFNVESLMAACGIALEASNLK